MTAALAPEVRADTRTSYAGEFRKNISELKGDDLAPLLAAIERTEKQTEELTATIPDDQYLPGNDELERQSG